METQPPFPPSGERPHVPPPGVAPTASPAPPASIPWEDREHLGALTAFWRTVTGVMLSPHAFYRRMPADGDLGPAILFALLVGIVGAVAGAFWQLLAGMAGFMRADFAEGFQNLAAVWVLVAMAPLLVLFELFTWSFITHLLLVLVNAGQGGFRATLRTVAYAMAPALLSVLPLCGGIAGSVWMIVLQVIGLALVHRTTYTRSAFATLFPVFVCAGLIVMLITLGVMGGLLAALTAAAAR